MYETVSGNVWLPDRHHSISPVPEPLLTYLVCCYYGPVLCISWIVQQINKLNLKYPVIWLICVLWCIKYESNWIGIGRKWTELELNWNILDPIWIGIELKWKILNSTWIGIELNWKKWIEPSPVTNFKNVYHIELLCTWSIISVYFDLNNVSNDW